MSEIPAGSGRRKKLFIALLAVVGLGVAAGGVFVLFSSDHPTVTPLGPEGEPLDEKWIQFEHGGYPVPTDSALFWARTHKMTSAEWALVRFPEGRVMARAKGFAAMFFLPGGETAGYTYGVAHTPLERLISWVRRTPAEPVETLWSVDYVEGRVSKLDAASLPAGSQPGLTAPSNYWLSSYRAPTASFVDVCVPFVPEAVTRGGGELAMRDDPKTARQSVVIDYGPGKPVTKIYEARPAMGEEVFIVAFTGGGSVILVGYDSKVFCVDPADGILKQVFPRGGGGGGKSLDELLYEGTY